MIYTDVLSLFAGIGGIDLGFKQAGFTTVYANEFDKYAVETFKKNFKDIPVDCHDVHDVLVDNLPEFNVLIGGFPCQAFSVAGYRQGFKDTKGRGELFFEITRILEQRKPEVVFLENVKNLVGHDNGNTFRVIMKELNRLGYHVKSAVLNACEYGNIPQNRERIYIVGFLDERKVDKFTFPTKIRLRKKLQDVIDFDKEQDSKYYYTAANCNFYDDLKKNIKRNDTVYQWRRVYVRENQNGMCPTLTANMGTGGHNVPLILTNDGRIRKLTPHECFNVQGFPKSFKLPMDMANTRLYKQAGNSVVVPVIKRIAKNILKVMQEQEE